LSGIDFSIGDGVIAILPALFILYNPIWSAYVHDLPAPNPRHNYSFTYLLFFFFLANALVLLSSWRHILSAVFPVSHHSVTTKEKK